jgi:hypothetical protein
MGGPPYGGGFRAHLQIDDRSLLSARALGWGDGARICPWPHPRETSTPAPPAFTRRGHNDERGVCPVAPYKRLRGPWAVVGAAECARHCLVVLEHYEIPAIVALSAHDARAYPDAPALFDRIPGLLTRFYIVFGRVPLFFYVVHLYWIHGLAVGAGYLSGFDPRAFLTLLVSFPQEYRFSLPVVYGIWIGVVMMLYPMGRWYGAFKASRPYRALAYL